jgi:hypothetical protein
MLRNVNLTLRRVVVAVVIIAVASVIVGYAIFAYTNSRPV